MKLTKSILTLILASALGCGLLAPQSVAAAKEEKSKTNVKKSKKKSDTTAKQDTIAKKTPPPAPGSLASVIKPGAKRSSGGMFTIFEQEGKYFIFMPKSLLGKDMMVVNRLSKAAAGVRSNFLGYAGDQIAEDMVRFQESPDKKKIFIETISTREIPRDTVGDMYKAVMKSNLQPLAASFDIKAQNQAKDSVLIDITDFILSDSPISGFHPMIKEMLSITALQKDRSYIQSVKSYPINTEIKSIKTFNVSSTNPMTGRPSGSEPATFEINTSLIMLPEKPMQPRYADPRVGYFVESYIDYDQNPQGIKQNNLISRWRLEPKEEDMEKYKRGELVEPQKPIIFYIDPATPSKWVPYLMQGVNDWQKAFEGAGFKNAIFGKVAPTPEEDSTWTLEDARYSAIVYKPSNIPNASGPHVHDPRSGEILESHINWYHNVMELLRDWYRVQVGPNDPQAHQMVFPDELMGQLIRFVSSHEVGHTLGLRHNFGSTSLTPVDSLRSATYLAKYGHTPSIMDYSRFNYVAQPEDKIDRELLFPRIQDYDLWAIEWGYRRFPELTTPQSEKAKLNEWIIEKSKNPRLWFGHESNPNDPRSQSEDLGDNQMKANELGIRNLKRVMQGLPEWTKVDNEGYEHLKTMHNQLLSQYNRYIGHVIKYVGGIYENPKMVEEPGDVYTFVEKAKQKEAMEFLDKQLFTAPQWLLDRNIMSKTGLDQNRLLASIYMVPMANLLGSRRINNMLNAQAALGEDAYTVSNFLSDLNGMVWRELVTGQKPDANRRTLQKSYVTSLISAAGLAPNGGQMVIRLGAGPVVVTDAASILRSELQNLQRRLAVATSTDPVVKAHYQYLAAQIKNALDDK